MAAVTIPLTLPAELIVLSSELIERIDGLVFKAQDLVITDYQSTKPADALHKEMRALVKEIQAARKTMTAPLDAIITQAIEAERMGTAPLLGAVESLGKRIQDAVDKHNRELEQKRIDAEKERQRLQKIEDDKAKEARRIALEQAELEALPGAPAPVESAVVITPTVVVRTPYVPKPAKSSAVRAATEYNLEYIDRAKVPAFTVLGHELRTIDEGALKKFLKSLPEGKQEIEGAVRLVKSSGIAAKG